MYMNVKKSVLDNGIRVLTHKLPFGSISMGIWVGVGGRYEEEAISGASHFIEHLLFKGTTTRSALEISEAIEGRGGRFNAFTQEDATCYYARIDSKRQEHVVDILTDMYMNPRFDKDDIEKERGVIIEEIMMYRDDPQHVVFEKLEEMMWSGHALGRSLTGTPKIIKNMSREDIIQFKEKNYVTGNTLIVVTGDVDHETLVTRLQERLGKLPERPAVTFTDVDGSVPQQKASIIHKEIEQSNLAMGFRIFSRHDERRYPLWLLNIIMGGNMSSRLFQEVREKHGLAYSISSSYSLHQDTGALYVSAGLDRKRGLKGLEVILQEIRKFKDAPVTEKELRMAKDYAAGSLMLGLENSTSQMMWIGQAELFWNAARQPDDIIALIEKITADQIQRVANEILTSENISISMVIPKKCKEKESQLIELMQTL